MGIPKYFKYITSNFNDLTIELDQTKVEIDHLYFDMNCLLHPCVRTVCKKNVALVQEYLILEKEEKFNSDHSYITRLETEIYREVTNYVNKILDLAKPKKTVYFAIDGVAPRAKMEQQRIRRYRTTKEKELSKEIYDKYNVYPVELDTNCITPGTVFLYKFCSGFLTGYIEQMAKANPSIKYVMDGCNSKGEGEHKLIQYIRNEFGESPNDIHSIYGLDADLIMLSLCSKQKIYLLREQVQFGMVDMDKFLYLDIDSFKEHLFNYIEQRINKDLDEKLELDKTNIIYDYVTLCFLIGNDFLPHIIGVDLVNDSINDILKIYINLFRSRNKYLVDNGKLNFQFLKLIFSNVFVNEHVYLQEYQEYLDNRRAYVKNASGMDLEIEKLKYYPIFHKNTVVKYGSKGWIDTYYKYYFNIENIHRNKSYINDICKCYVDGLQWNLEYYINDCPSWSWYYQYRAAPCLRELVYYLQSRVYPPNFADGITYSPLEQLAIVLPVMSKHLWPNQYQNALITDKQLKSYYPDGISLDCSNKYYLHDCNPRLFNVDDNYIKQSLGCIKLSNFDILRNAVTTKKIFN